jgi:hypothetical protein
LVLRPVVRDGDRRLEPIRDRQRTRMAAAGDLDFELFVIATRHPQSPGGETSGACAFA